MHELVAAAYVVCTGAVAVVLVVRLVVDVRDSLREADTAATQPMPADDLFALAESLHVPTCRCFDCQVGLKKTARAVHEADQLDALYELKPYKPQTLYALPGGAVPVGAYRGRPFITTKEERHGHTGR